MIRAIVLFFKLPSLLLLSMLCNANEGTVAFVGATIIDGTDAAPLEDLSLIHI